MSFAAAELKIAHIDPDAREILEGEAFPEPHVALPIATRLGVGPLHGMLFLMKGLEQGELHLLVPIGLTVTHLDKKNIELRLAASLGSLIVATPL